MLLPRPVFTMFAHMLTPSAIETAICRRATHSVLRELLRHYRHAVTGVRCRHYILLRWRYSRFVVLDVIDMKVSQILC